MATDNFLGHVPGLGSPAIGGFSITPHDTNELPQVTRALRIGSSDGTLSITFVDGSEIILTVLAHEILPFRVKKVKVATTVDVWGLV